MNKLKKMRKKPRKYDLITQPEIDVILAAHIAGHTQLECSKLAFEATKRGPRDQARIHAILAENEEKIELLKKNSDETLLDRVSEKMNTILNSISDSDLDDANLAQKVQSFATLHEKKEKIRTGVDLVTANRNLNVNIDEMDQDELLKFIQEKSEDQQSKNPFDSR